MKLCERNKSIKCLIEIGQYYDNEFDILLYTEELMRVSWNMKIVDGNRFDDNCQKRLYHGVGHQ